MMWMEETLKRSLFAWESPSTRMKPSTTKIPSFVCREYMMGYAEIKDLCKILKIIFNENAYSMHCHRISKSNYYPLLYTIQPKREREDQGRVALFSPRKGKNKIKKN